MSPELVEKIKKYYTHDDPSHDWSHILRVSNLCERFARELGADLKVLIPAAYLHDIINIPKNSKHRHKASELASKKSVEILGESEFSSEEITKIGTIVLEHSYSANISPSSIESAILQDADKLDGMGAIGVMRWATVGCRMKASYYDLEDPWAENRELDDKSYSLDHFKTKLLKLYDRLNTAPAKIEGQRRLDFYQSFLAQLETEIVRDNFSSSTSNS